MVFDFFYIPAAYEEIPETSLSGMQFLVWDFPDTFVFYTVLWFFFIMISLFHCL